MISRMAAGWLLALPAAPAFATCQGWQVCRDGWLWDAVLPGMILAGLAIWVAGPFIVAALRAVSNRRRASGGGDRRSKDAGPPGDASAA